MQWTVGAVLFFIPSLLCAAKLMGKVVSILDGDTIEVLYNQHAEHKFLSGIDCPALRAI